MITKKNEVVMCPRIERCAVKLCLHFAALYRSTPDTLEIVLIAHSFAQSARALPIGISIVEVDLYRSRGFHVLHS